MPNPLTIRAAEGAEANSLTRLAIRSKAYWGYSEDFLAACQSELTVTENHIVSPEYQYAVGVIDLAIVGYYAIERRPGRPHELEALYVDPDWIGRGIGGELLAHARTSASRLGAFGLRVQSDPNAEGFYQAAGGQFVGSRESGSVPGRLLAVFELPLVNNSLMW